LSLSNNRLKHLPAGITRLGGMEVFNFAGNMFQIDKLANRREYARRLGVLSLAELCARRVAALKYAHTTAPPPLSIVSQKLRT
jgi:hypothetical protein